jgi:hypothetical protein
MHRLTLALSLSLLVLPLASGCTDPVAAGGGIPSEPTVVQTLSQFHRPESCAFSLDGGYLYVSNCGSGFFGPEEAIGLVRDQGAISKLQVTADGLLEVIDLNFVEGLSTPLGITVLPRATDRFPAGTLFVVVGNALSVDADGNMERRAEALGTAALAIDPEDGALLGRIRLDVESAVADWLGHPLLLPNGAAFDREGNYYIGDSGVGGERLEPPRQGNPGVVRIDHAALDVLAADAPHPGVHFISVPGGPNGVAYHDGEDAIYIVTFGGGGPEGEAIYAVARDGFVGGELPEPLHAGVGTLDGLAITPAGTLIASRMDGDLIAIPAGGQPQPIELAPEPIAFAGPSDIKLSARPDGRLMLIVPEQEPAAAESWSQRLHVVHLPQDY